MQRGEASEWWRRWTGSFGLYQMDGFHVFEAAGITVPVQLHSFAFDLLQQNMQRHYGTEWQADDKRGTAWAQRTSS
jgi:hypothetical protein